MYFFFIYLSKSCRKKVNRYSKWRCDDCIYSLLRLEARGENDSNEKKEHIQMKCISKHPRTHRANIAEGKKRLPEENERQKKGGMKIAYTGLMHFICLWCTYLLMSHTHVLTASMWMENKTHSHSEHINYNVAQMYFHGSFQQSDDFYDDICVTDFFFISYCLC